MKWFRHETSAHIDAKLIKLQMRYGLEGYGLYWYCLEMIAGSVEPHNLTFELEHDAEVIAHYTGLHQDKVEQVMTYMVDVGLFENDRGVITCLKMAKRMDSSMTSNPKMRKLIKAIREKHGFSLLESPESHDGVMTPSAEGHDSVMQEKKKERKIDRGRFTPPTREEVENYCKTRGNNVDPQGFLDHYEANGWMRGKTKIKDWKACVRTWERNQKPVADDQGRGFL